MVSKDADREIALVLFLRPKFQSLELFWPRPHRLPTPSVDNIDLSKPFYGIKGGWKRNRSSSMFQISFSSSSLWSCGCQRQLSTKFIFLNHFMESKENEREMLVFFFKQVPGLFLSSSSLWGCVWPRSRGLPTPSIDDVHKHESFVLVDPMVRVEFYRVARGFFLSLSSNSNRLSVTIAC